MNENHQDLRLTINNIVCTGCATDLETVLEDQEGVERARVDYGRGILEIRYDPEEISGAELIAKVNGLGFKSQPLK